VTDLDAAIRERLALDEDGHYFRYDSEMIQRAVLAVLDLHRPIEGRYAGVPACSCLPDPSDEAVAHEWPCPTVLAIAEKLGIET
jgi:hypothetical protein